MVCARGRCIFAVAALLILSLASALPGTCEVKDDKLVDKDTGIAFDTARAFASVSKAQSYGLLGAGPRKKNLYVAHVNVYSVGLYTNPSQTTAALKKFKGKSADELAKDEGYYKALSDSSLDKALHLIFARSVGANKVVDALTALEGVDKAVLDDFSQSLLKAIGSSIHKGESVTLAQVGNKLVVEVRDKPVKTFNSPQLANALFSLYLGPKAISPEAKAGFAALAPRLLNPGRAAAA